ncbi:hypothetical protein JVU11DRAFT_7597 [Chiua virens]|nr:hypothetical protein JVU11DRAFT_7597 [Chiua virens]
MYLGDPLFGATPASQATVNPADILLSQPPHEPLQTPGIPYIFSSYLDSSAEGHGTSEGPQSHPPIWPAHPMGHILNEAVMPFIGPIRHFRRAFRGVPVADAASTVCQWQRLGFPTCGQAITRESLSEHLAHHGIYKMHKDIIVQCCWQGCGAFLKRQSVTRHCREVHLRVRRNSPNFDAFFWDAFVVDVF